MHPTNAILRIVKAMRPWPEVAQRVLTLVQDPNYAIDDLVALIRTDTTLVARVLRLCNSARSGLDHEITAIGDAVTYVGTRNLVQLTLVSCSAATFASAPTSAYTDPKALWHHSLACALLSQELAQQLGVVSPPTAFTAGILHDIGRVVLGQLATNPGLPSDDPHTAPPRAHELLEREVFGMDHAEVAGLVGDAWRLPTTLVEALRTHHVEAAMLAADELPAILHVADQLALQQGLAVPFRRATATISPVALARLELTPDQLAPIAARATAEMQRTVDLLNLEANGCR